MKCRYFHSVKNLHLVTVSKWLESQVQQSFMQDIDIRTIHNGLNTEVFKPTGSLSPAEEGQAPLVLGVSNVWYEWKGLEDFARLRDLLPDDYEIMLVGVSEDQMHRLPEGITCIRRTDSISQLAAIYAQADVFVSPSWGESFGMTTAEALSCGTPAIVYETSACPEIVDSQTGRVVPLGNVEALSKAVVELCERPDKETMRKACRQRAVTLFDQQDKYQEYFNLYTDLLKHKS